MFPWKISRLQASEGQAVGKVWPRMHASKVDLREGRKEGRKEGRGTGERQERVKEERRAEGKGKK